MYICQQIVLMLIIQKWKFENKKIILKKLKNY